MENKKDQIVLVTGASGFIAQYCIIQLLKEGYQVRATLRSLTRQNEVLAKLSAGGANPFGRLTFVQADLASDQNWAEAAKGCTYVLHVASPTPKLKFDHEDEMIVPAKEGVLHVLKAARDAGVKRVVLTSAIGAVVYGHPDQTEPYNERYWTDTRSAPAYQKSKTLAERAAWKFIKEEGRGLELAAINPTGVMGPVLDANYTHSIDIIKNMLTGKMAGCPKINSGFVDVRDVADLHLRAMVDDKANGERFIATAGPSIWMVEVAKILKSNLGNAAAKVNTKQLPSTLLKVFAMKDAMIKSIVPLLGKHMNATSEKAINLLGWSPRPTKEAILASAESLIRLNLL